MVLKENFSTFIFFFKWHTKVNNLGGTQDRERETKSYFKLLLVYFKSTKYLLTTITLIIIIYVLYFKLLLVYFSLLKDLLTTLNP